MKLKVLLGFILSLIVVGQGYSQQKSDYPYQPVPFSNVNFNDVFWAPRIETNRTVTIPFAFGKCEETGRYYNFERAAKVLNGEEVLDRKPPGLSFDDTDPYKVLEGASFGLSVKYDAEMDAYLDKVIALIASAQEPDGYLYTARTIDPEHPHEWAGNKRWVNVKALSHELYNMGHLYEAAAAHYQATGKKTLLNIAIKTADLLCDVFGPGKDEDAPGHQIVEMGLVKLYRITGEKKYLDLARFFLDTRGPNDGEYSQAHKKVIDQDEAVGHAVRATYMYCGMADVAAIENDSDYIKAIDNIWNNVVTKKLYITGGIGATHSGEAFGPNYHLPNMSAYCETCAAIGNVYWNHRMFLLHGDGKYIDVLERSLYNGVISGVSLDGKGFFYPNPLESTGQYRRSPWFGCACCPSNITRFLASVPGYAYAVRNDDLFVNLYAAGSADVKLADGEVKLTQQTKYPWDGDIKITVDSAAGKDFNMCLRIPGWAMDKPVPSDLYSYVNSAAGDPEIKLNGKIVALNVKNGYVSLNKKWKKGDVVDISFPMSPRLVKANDKVKEDRGRLSIERGPIVYCLEGVDSADGHVRNLFIDPELKMSYSFEPDLLGGVGVIKAMASVAGLDANGNNADSGKKVKFTAIPYSTWCNRKIGEMTVWIPTDPSQAYVKPLPTIASESKVTASRGSGSPKFMVSQAKPKSSADKDNQFYHWWPKKGTSEWVQFDFDKPTDISSIKVYWLDDTGAGECKVPLSWRVLYKDGNEYKPAVSGNGFTVEKDMYNATSITKVKTTSIKLEIQLQPNWSAGILQVMFD